MRHFAKNPGPLGSLPTFESVSFILFFLAMIKKSRFEGKDSANWPQNKTIQSVFRMKSIRLINKVYAKGSVYIRHHHNNHLYQKIGERFLHTVRLTDSCCGTLKKAQVSAKPKLELQKIT